MNDNKADIETSPAGYQLTPDQRFELIKAGFLLTDANSLGFNFFSKIENVLSQKIYYLVKGFRYRAVYMTTPSIFKDYVGMNTPNGNIYGFKLGVPEGASLEIHSLTQIRFIEQ